MTGIIESKLYCLSLDDVSRDQQLIWEVVKLGGSMKQSRRKCHAGILYKGIVKNIW